MLNTPLRVVLCFTEMKQQRQQKTDDTRTIYSIALSANCIKKCTEHAVMRPLTALGVVAHREMSAGLCRMMRSCCLWNKRILYSFRRSFHMTFKIYG